MDGDGATYPRLPGSAWVMAWAWLAGQVVSVLQFGFQENDPALALVSMLLSGLVVGWVAAGVLRARMVRVVIVWVLTVLVAVFEAVAVVLAPGPSEFLWLLAALVSSVVVVAAMASFCRSDYFAWQRERPGVQGPPIGQLVTIAVVVGGLGGLVGPLDGEGGSEVNISLVEPGPGGQLRR